MEVNIVVASEAVGFPTELCCCISCDDGAIVEDGGEVVVEVICCSSVAVWCQTELWLLHRLLMLVL